MEQIKWIIGLAIACVIVFVAWKGIRSLLKKMKMRTPGKKHWWTGRKPEEVASIYLGTLGCIAVTVAVTIGLIWTIRIVYLKW
jgi:hypothetical protein